MRLGSLFDGIGGFPYSAQRHGITPVWASEIEPSCVSITKRHFSSMKHLGDITKINGADIEPVDIISFGSPCQDLSVAGKRAGLEGARSGLFGEAIRIIDEMRGITNAKYPRFAIWENVPGALSSSNGLDFKAVLQSFAGCEIPMPDSGRWANSGMVRGGRCDIAWRILDAQHWGVPQRRRRIFLVADFRGQRVAEVLFKPESLRGDFAQGGTQRQEIAGRAGNSVEDAVAYAISGNTIGRKPKNGGNGLGVQEGISPTLTSIDRHAVFDCRNGAAGFNGWRSITGSIEYQEECAPCVQASMPPNAVIPINTQIATRHKQLGERTGLGIGENGDPAFTLQAAHSHAICAAFMAGQGEKAGGIGYQDEVAPTLRASNSGTNQAPSVLCVSTGQGNAEICENIAPTLNCNHEQPYIASSIVRRLTPVECEKLQGFPDNWTAYGHDDKPISDTKRYAAIGNSVAIPCVDYIMQGIIDVTPRTGK